MQNQQTQADDVKSSYDDIARGEAPNQHTYSLVHSLKYDLKDKDFEKLQKRRSLQSTVQYGLGASIVLLASKQLITFALSFFKISFLSTEAVFQVTPFEVGLE